MGKIATPEYNLEILYPDVAKEWHPTKNKLLTLKDVTPGCNKKVWWKCKGGHEWQTLASNLKPPPQSPGPADYLFV
jgi:hypothetical protein